MSLRVGCGFVYLLNLITSSYLVSDSFFSESTLPRSNPNPLLAARWRNLFSNQETLLNPVLGGSREDNLNLPPLNYPQLFPEVFNESKLFSNLFLEARPLRESIDLFDVLQKNVRDDIVAKTINLTKIDAEDEDVFAKDAEETSHTSEESEVTTVKSEDKAEENKDEELKKDAVTVENQNLHQEEEEKDAVTEENHQEEKEERSVDDAERITKTQEITTTKTVTEDGNIEKENGKFNVKTEKEETERNLEKNRKEIMSVENDESKKTRTTSGEEKDDKLQETKEEKTREDETNEIKMEETKENLDSDGESKENVEETNVISDVNSRKLEETLRETLPDELSNSDLNVLQDNSTNFICLTDSSKCLSKSTSILLTTGILIGIIVGLVTVVGITTGLSVYIFHRWKLRKKPHERSKTSKIDRVTSYKTRRPANFRSTKRKLNLEVAEDNDSPVNTLEAITVHNYGEDGRNPYNL